MKAVLRLLLVVALIVPAFAPLGAQAQTQAAPTCRLFASNTIVGYNTKVRLDWQSRNATSGYLTSVGAIAAKGSASVVPGKNTTYAASFTGPGGTVVCRVAIAVRAQGVSVGGADEYSGGIVNIDGTTDLRGTTIDTAPIGSDINTNQPINNNVIIDTAPIGTGIDTNQPINTNKPVDLGGKVDLGGNVTLPTVPSVSPSGQSSSGFTGGLVPAECRGASTVANCDLCSLAQMGQNVANFLLGLTIPAAAILFAWAGILFFSSRGNPAQITQAKSVFKKVVIGFVIAVSAWILVNTVMNMLIQGSDFQGWNWRSLNCTQTRQARLYNMSLSQYLQSSLPSTQSYTSPMNGSAFGDSCPNGGTLSVTETGNLCITDNGSYAASSGSSGGTFTLTAAQEDKYTRECADGNMDSCYVLDQVGQPAYGAGGSCGSGSVYVQDGADASSGSCYNPIDDTMSDPLQRTSGVGGAGYTQEQQILLDACSKGDTESCRNFSASSGSGELGARISAAVQKYQGTDTSAGPDEGNKACAWAVNNILKSAGIAPLGNGVAVDSLEAALNNGRGTLVGTGSAVPGDVIVWKQGSVSHVGICQNNGCTSAISNSSSKASFTNVSGSTLLGVQGRVYHLNN